MKRALLLNADYAPIKFISDVDAITLFYKQRVEVVYGLDGNLSEWDEEFRSPSTSIKVPATLRLLKRVTKKWKVPRFRKKVLYNRDNWSCQFCGEHLNWKTITVDHLLPSSRGGDSSWLNCVVACKACNRYKSNKTPEEAGMTLLNKPAPPNSFHFWDLQKCSDWHDEWNIFLNNN
jgi:5-methylcytosine-specific restriction endonuclease McrA